MLTGAISSFERHLRAANKAPRTIQTYVESAVAFDTYLAGEVKPEDVTHEHVEGFLIDLRQRGRKSTTVSVRYRSLQQFFRWLVDEEEIDANPMAKMPRPHVEEEAVPVIGEEQLLALFRQVSGKTFLQRRDRAILSVLLDTGMRRAELVGLTMDDLDLEQNVLHVMGKGRRPRACPFDRVTAVDLDRYLRVRARHASAKEPHLWLADHGGQFTKSGLAQMLWKRGRDAGIGPIHPHQFRHTFAHVYLESGGAEGDLMRLTGWRDRKMVDRYAKFTAESRAIKAHRDHSPRNRLG